MGSLAPIDAALFKRSLAQWPSGVTVISTRHEGTVYGMTASSFTSLSLDPPLVLVAVDHRARLHHFLPLARRYGVSVLAQGQAPLSAHFAGRPQEGLPIPWVESEGLPLLEGAVAQLVCEIDAELPGGDHTIYVGRITHAAAWPEREPLLHQAGKYRSFAPLPPAAVPSAPAAAPAKAKPD